MRGTRAKKLRRYAKVWCKHENVDAVPSVYRLNKRLWHTLNVNQKGRISAEEKQRD